MKATLPCVYLRKNWRNCKDFLVSYHKLNFGKLYKELQRIIRLGSYLSVSGFSLKCFKLNEFPLCLSPYIYFSHEVLSSMISTMFLKFLKSNWLTNELDFEWLLWNDLWYPIGRYLTLALCSSVGCPIHIVYYGIRCLILVLCSSMRQLILVVCSCRRYPLMKNLSRELNV